MWKYEQKKQTIIIFVHNLPISSFIYAPITKQLTI